MYCETVEMSVKSYTPAKCLSKSVGSIATAPDGTLWYTSNRSVLTQIDQSGRALAELQIKGFKPSAIAIDANYTFWLADQFRFARYSRDGKQALISGGKGIRKGQFNTITSIDTLADNTIVIVDMYTHRLQHFDQNGRFLNQWGGYGIRGEGKFNYIGGMTVTENDHIYTVENAIPNKCERVQHFENNGRFIRQWGKEGTANGEFTSPCGIFNDRKGSLFVCDSYRLQQFDYTGKHIQNIPYPKMNKWNWAHGGAVSENGTLFVCHSQTGLWMYKTI